MYMGKYLEKVFRLSQYGTNIKTEMIAGITTFVTMAYVLATVPNMLGSAGLNKKCRNDSGYTVDSHYHMCNGILHKQTVCTGTWAWKYRNSGIHDNK